MSKNEIDRVTAEFYGAFDNRGGKAADVDRLRRLVLPQGVIVCTAPTFTAYSVEEFVEPRAQLLSSGRLVGFSEWETSEETRVERDVASRFGTYRKSGVFDGKPYEGEGTKTIQFVRTPDGWRIAAFSWFDHT